MARRGMKFHWPRDQFLRGGGVEGQLAVRNPCEM
jgi:hypothetical protein